jgi:hypothetical protein
LDSPGACGDRQAAPSRPPSMWIDHDGAVGVEASVLLCVVKNNKDKKKETMEKKTKYM